MHFSYRSGIHVTASDLWLDATRARPSAVISHAHADHVRRHAAADATAATAALVLERYARGMTVTSRRFGEPFMPAESGVGGPGRTRVTLYPAGHVLGSAQVLVEHGDRRLLYSGDLRLRPSPAAEPVEVPRADMLIVDSTFGHPRYVFPTDDEVVASIVRFCERSFETGRTPVLLAYALGKAQEAIAHLHRHDLRVAVHPSVQRINAVYRRHGVDLPECADAAPGLPARTVVVAPPQARRSGLLLGLGPVRTAVLTGWAMDAGARFRYRADAAFPLSDHCGFDDLLRYVELVGAREVYTVFGQAEQFAAELQRRGVQAFPAGRPAQLALPGLA